MCRRKKKIEELVNEKNKSKWGERDTRNEKCKKIYPSKITEEDNFEKIKARMEKTQRYEVINSEGCPHLKNNKLGIYCRMGTRRVKYLKQGKKEIIVCLDCDESRNNWVEVMKKEFEELERQKRP